MFDDWNWVFKISFPFFWNCIDQTIIFSNQRSLRDSTILHGVCIGEKMIILKAICDD